MTYPNAVFSAFAFIGFVVCAIPLPWHLHAYNSGTCMFMIWTGLACLNQFINSVVWTGNAINWAPVFCDISTRFMVAYSFALPATSLCINRRLYHIACVRTVTTTKADKRREMVIDLAIGVGFPLLGMILYYIIQGHRFDIFEDIGCYPFPYYVWPIYPLLYLPPIIVGLVSGTYCTLTIVAFYKNRSQFKSLLSSGSKVNPNRFLRLMCLASVDPLINIPFNVVGIVLQSRIRPLYPWISWASVHADFSRVDQIPSVLWRQPSNLYTAISLEMSRWGVVFCAFIFFFFFGFADEAKKNYKLAFQSVAKRVGISTASFGSGATSEGFFKTTSFMASKDGPTGKVRPILPIFVHEEMLRRHDSIESFTNMSLSIADVGGTLADEKSDPEKQDVSPIRSYGGLSVLTKDDSSLSPHTSLAPSSASSLSYPTPALTRPNSSIEVSSVRHSTTSIEFSNFMAVPTSSIHPTGDNTV